MHYTLASLALAAVAAAAPQGVTSAISPPSSPPAGCQTSFSGTFSIETVNLTSSSKRDLQRRQAGALSLTLANGILKDSQGRTGYIAGGNSQFQFDNPPQTGAQYTAGWSVCSNGTLAIGGYTVFQQCLQAPVNGQDGYYDLYLESSAPQCSPIYIEVTSSSSSGGVTQQADGQPTATPKPLTQISDGQIQATTGAVTQISDGQVQATRAKNPVTQISDGQIQATTAKNPVTQISDGQVQATTAKNPVTQITDGQIQAPTKSTGTPVVQISDGQIRATAGPSGTATGTRATYTGAAAIAGPGEVFGLAVGALAVALL